MTPDDVAEAKELLLRFQDEVAYLDRTRPSEDETRADAELLNSDDGTMIIAWLWPTRIYLNEDDPFQVAARLNQALWESVANLPPGLDAENGIEAVEQAFKRRQLRQREVISTRFRLIIEWTAEKVACSIEELKAHLKWSVPLSDLELDRMLTGCTPFPFSIILKLCYALQLEFVDAGFQTDTQRLTRCIGQSVVASSLSSELQYLSLENLETIAKRLPRGTANAGRARELEIYHAPQPGGRYWSLYTALAADGRDAPDYSLEDIDRLLVEAGEKPLPISATTDRSWWSGSGRKPEGRPQVSAWWGAGYRIRKVARSQSGRITAIGFEALPGRTGWLSNPNRVLERKYGPRGSEKVWIYPKLDGAITALTGLAKASEVLMGGVDIEGLAAALTPLAKASVLDRVAELHPLRNRLETDVPNDPDVRCLVSFLNETGEASRSQIERHFRETLAREVDPQGLTNLLTKARRQGWTVNNGTRNQPRWAVSRPKEQ